MPEIWGEIDFFLKIGAIVLTTRRVALKKVSGWEKDTILCRIRFPEGGSNTLGLI